MLPPLTPFQFLLSLFKKSGRFSCSFFCVLIELPNFFRLVLSEGLTFVLRLSFRPYFGYYSERFSFASGFCRAFLPGKRARVSRLFMTGDTKRNLNDLERRSFFVFFCPSFGLFFFDVLAELFNATFYLFYFEYTAVRRFKRSAIL